MTGEWEVPGTSGLSGHQGPFRRKVGPGLVMVRRGGKSVPSGGNRQVRPRDEGGRALRSLSSPEASGSSQEARRAAGTHETLGDARALAGSETEGSAWALQLAILDLLKILVPLRITPKALLTVAQKAQPPLTSALQAFPTATPVSLYRVGAVCLKAFVLSVTERHTLALGAPALTVGVERGAFPEGIKCLLYSLLQAFT